MRVKRGTTKLRKRKKLLAQAKGYRWGRSKKLRQAREAVLHAGNFAYAHRKTKKRDMRRLWQIKISAAVRALGLSYSKFIDALKKKKVNVDRKILADIAENNPEVFKRIVENTIE